MNEKLSVSFPLPDIHCLTHTVGKPSGILACEHQPASRITEKRNTGTQQNRYGGDRHLIDQVFNKQ
jgi:hypothetical protein